MYSYYITIVQQTMNQVDKNNYINLAHSTQKLNPNYRYIQSSSLGLSEFCKGYFHLKRIVDPVIHIADDHRRPPQGTFAINVHGTMVPR